MVYQQALYLKKTDMSGCWSELCVKLHGYLMSIVPRSAAAEFHNGGLQPFSLWCGKEKEYDIVILSGLSEQAETLFGAMEDVTEVNVIGAEKIPVIGRSGVLKTDFRAAAQRLSFDRCRLRVMTPALYKSKGVLRFDPVLPPYFDSVIQKLALFEDIRYTREELDEAFERVIWNAYEFKSAVFTTGNRKLRGMTGRAELTLPSEGAASALLRNVLTYATFSGIGGQTTQGMGGFSVKEAVKKDISTVKEETHGA